MVPGPFARISSISVGARMPNSLNGCLRFAVGRVFSPRAHTLFLQQRALPGGAHMEPTNGRGFRGNGAEGLGYGVGWNQNKFSVKGK